MRIAKQSRMVRLPLVTAFGLIVAACGTGTAGGGSGAEVVEVSGSSTVLPISTAVGESFMEVNDASVNVDGPGTGDGFELFCNEETDISNASRPIRDEETEACENNGVEYIELKVAFDGMAVMTHPENDAVECLSFAELYALIGPEAEGTQQWSDVQRIASELGSTAELPDAELALTGPGTESGTFDSFVEIAIDGIAEERGQSATTRTDYSASPDDNVIMSNIGSSNTSLGWVGFAYAAEAGDAVRLVGVSEEPGGDCVVPNADTIADESYPLSRALYIYVSSAKTEGNPALVPFVDHYLENLTELVALSGYVPLPDEQVEQTLAAWEDR